MCPLAPIPRSVCRQAGDLVADDARHRGADARLPGRLQRGGAAGVAAVLRRARAGADALRNAGDRRTGQPPVATAAGDHHDGGREF